jgi:hypothetical protein
MPFTCEVAGSVWPDVAWSLTLLAPNLAPGDIVSRVNVRTAAANFDSESRSSNLQARGRERIWRSGCMVSCRWPFGVDAEHREARQDYRPTPVVAVIGERDPGLAVPQPVAEGRTQVPD